MEENERKKKLTQKRKHQKVEANSPQFTISKSYRKFSEQRSPFGSPVHSLHITSVDNSYNLYSLYSVEFSQRVDSHFEYSSFCSCMPPPPRISHRLHSFTLISSLCAFTIRISESFELQRKCGRLISHDQLIRRTDEGVYAPNSLIHRRAGTSCSHFLPAFIIVFMLRAKALGTYYTESMKLLAITWITSLAYLCCQT